MGTLQVATNCFFTALNWTTGKLTVVDSRLVSSVDVSTPVSDHMFWHKPKRAVTIGRNTLAANIGSH